MDRTVDTIERLAGLSLLVVATLTFAMVILRKFFGTTIPDWYDLSRLLQGIAIFWGIACACWRNGHISVDLLWEGASRAGRRRIDLLATAVLLVFVAALAFIAVQAALESRGQGLRTADLRMPQWPFYLVGALGLAAAAWLALLRLARLWSGGRTGDAARAVPGDDARAAKAATEVSR